MAIKKYILTLCCFLGLNLANAQFEKKLENLIEKAYQIIEGDSSEKKDNFFVVLPIWGIYPETGWRLGLSNVYFFKTNHSETTRPSIARLNLLYTQFGQYSIKPFIDIFTNNNKYNIKSFMSFTGFNEYFYGIGNRKKEGNRELYYFTLIQAEARVTKQIKPNLYSGILLHHEQMKDIKYTANTTNLLQNAPGGSGSNTIGAGLIVAFDNRDKIYFPLKGSYVETNLSIHTQDNGNNYGIFTLDSRKYIKLYKKNVVALQFYTKSVEGNAPFRQLPGIGNDMIMRGFYNGIFRDKHMAAFQAEWRQSIWGPAGFVVFAGAGNIGSTITELNQFVKPNYGIGLRGVAFRKEHVNIRIDYGRGPNGIQGFYFTMGEAF